MYQEKPDTFERSEASGLDTARSLTREFVFLAESGSVAFVAESCIDVLRAANQLLCQDIYSWKLHVGEPDDVTVPICGPKQTLVLVGGVHQPWMPSLRLVTNTRSSIRNAARGCIIGAAIFLPIVAGLLKDRKAAVHPKFRTGVSENNYLLEFAEEITHHSSSISSAVSPVAAIQMMVELVGAREGEYTAIALKNYLGLATSDNASCSDEHWRYKRQAEGNRVVGRALDLMSGHLEETLPMEQIATTLGVSPRQLERKFSCLFGQPPLRIYRNLRLERSHKLLVQTTLSVSEISVACGFSTTSQLSKWYKKRFGLAPAEARKIAFRGNLAT